VSPLTQGLRYRAACNGVTSHTAAVRLAYVDTGLTATYLFIGVKHIAEHKVTNMSLTKPINHGH